MKLSHRKSHFEELGTNVWIFREDVKELSKLDPREKKHIFVGYADWPKAVRYYDRQSHKVKISQNFLFESGTSIINILT